MGNRIKLTEPGSSYIGRVTRVDLNKSGKWPDYEFHVENGDTIQMPQKAADRQIERLKVGTAFDLAGTLIKVSRSDEPGENGKLFWNLDLASPAEAKPSKRIPPPTATSTAQPQPFDQPARSEGHSGPPDAPLVGEDDDEPTPLTAKAEGERIQREALERTYFALWARCAAYQARVGAADRVPVDGSSVNAMAATIWVAFDKQGLLRGIASSALQDAAGDV